MLDQLEKLQLDVVHYRQAVDHIFSPALTTSKSWQACFSEILVCTAELYLDYLRIQRELPDLESFASKTVAFGMVPANSSREMSLRRELGKRLKSIESWPGFMPQNSYPEITGLRTIGDYANILTLHLSEIHEESFRVEVCSKAFLDTHSSSALAQLSVGLRHLGQEHISFVLQPLEWAADEGSWDESLVTAVH